MIEADKEVELRLPWSTICYLACKARVTGESFSDLCERAIRELALNFEFQKLCDEPGTTIDDLGRWADAHGCEVQFNLTPRAESVV